MGALAWIITGVIAGFLAKAITPSGRGQEASYLGAMLIGIVGAVIGGWVWNLFLAQPGAHAYDPIGLVSAFVGSILITVLLRLLDRKPIQGERW